MAAESRVGCSVGHAEGSPRGLGAFAKAVEAEADLFCETGATVEDRQDSSEDLEFPQPAENGPARPGPYVGTVELAQEVVVGYGASVPDAGHQLRDEIPLGGAAAQGVQVAQHRFAMGPRSRFPM